MTLAELMAVLKSASPDEQRELRRLFGFIEPEPISTASLNLFGGPASPIKELGRSEKAGEPVRRFATEAEAEEWLYNEVDDGCIDNFRLAYEDDPSGSAAYEKAYANGCCGEADYDVVIGGRRARIGCNYGH
jgi:hypothetical protein